MSTTNGHKGRLDKLAATVRAAGESEYDRVPTRCLYGIERFQAAANYDHADPATVAARVADVDRSIDAVDRIRTDHGTDIIGASMLKHACMPNLSYSADSIAASVVEACWRYDAERYGESYAWAHQRNRDRVAGVVKNRMDSDAGKALVGLRRLRVWLKTLSDSDVDTLASVAEHVKRTGSFDGLDSDVQRHYDEIAGHWQARQEGGTA